MAVNSSVEAKDCTSSPEQNSDLHSETLAEYLKGSCEGQSPSK